MRFTFSTSHELPLQRANVAIVIAKFFKKLKFYESCDFIPYLSTDRRETGVSRTIAFPNWSLGTSRVAFTLNSYQILFIMVFLYKLALMGLHPWLYAFCPSGLLYFDSLIYYAE